VCFWLLAATGRPGNPHAWRILKTKYHILRTCQLLTPIKNKNIFTTARPALSDRHPIKRRACVARMDRRPVPVACPWRPGSPFPPGHRLRLSSPALSCPRRRPILPACKDSFSGNPPQASYGTTFCFYAWCFFCLLHIFYGGGCGEISRVYAGCFAFNGVDGAARLEKCVIILNVYKGFVGVFFDWGWWV